MPTINVSSYDGIIKNVKVLDTVQLNGTTNNLKFGLNNGVSGVNTSLIAIGENALSLNTGNGSIGIGYGAGYLGSSTNSVCIGNQSGQNGIGACSVAIGLQAGLSCPTKCIDINASGIQSIPASANTIVLNASNAELSPATSGTFVAPIRGITASGYTPNVAGSGSVGMLLYNPATGEISYAAS